MNKAQLVVVVLLLAPLVLVYLWAGGHDCALCPAGLPLYGWGVALFSVVVAGVILARWGGLRAYGLLLAPPPAAPHEGGQRLSNAQRLKYDPEGPDYPHPVIITDICIGCYRCIEACPHDVLTITHTEQREPVAAVAAADLCMDDTSCERACPVGACVVVNTEKEIKPPKKPHRDDSFMSRSLPGCYVVGDVSGAPLIANAVAEGAKVIEAIASQPATPDEAGAELDVVIVGVGPAGLSAAVAAKRAGLKFVAVEQKQSLSTVVAFGEHKYIALKRPKTSAAGGLELVYPGQTCGPLVEAWKDDAAGLEIAFNPPDVTGGAAIFEYERCTDIKRAADGNYLIVITERVRPPTRQTTYRTRRVVLAIGQRSEPKKLNDHRNVVPGENLRITSKVWREGRMVEVTGPKVLYELSDPERFQGLNLIVIGSGNSAVEAAVDLVAGRDGDRITSRAAKNRNQVTMLIRGPGFKPDVTFGNKQHLYECRDQGLVTVLFQTEVAEIREREVVYFDAKSRRRHVLYDTDYVFAFIGSEPPTEFLKQIDIKME